ncbi:MAG TPA: (d)CMP kinase [bacterium]|nr:(d)CMP kinase [bacterium]
MVVTLDGPAASGKSTTARLVAKEMGWLYLDTGAMYRAMAVKVLDEGIPLDDPEAIGAMARRTKMTLKASDEGTRVFLDGVEVTHRIRTPEVDRAVGPVCEVPVVREVLVALQREIGKKGSLVAEGRDMGTVVFPDADLKFYVIASIEARARRRRIDMERQGISVSLDELIHEIERRDRRDSERTHSPLRPAGDAGLLDTSEMTLEQQVGTVVQKIHRKMAR